MTDEKNYASDFVNAIQGSTAQRGLPPLHPHENERWVDLAAEDTGLDSSVANSPNLLDLSKQRIFVHYRQFQLNDPAQVAELEQIVNKCVSTKDGWVLAREEWDLDAKGNKIVTIKYLEIEKIKKRKTKKEEAGATAIPIAPASDDEILY